MSKNVNTQNRTEDLKLHSKDNFVIPLQRWNIKDFQLNTEYNEINKLMMSYSINKKAYKTKI